METAVVRLSMPGGVGGQRCKPLPTRLEIIVDKEGTTPAGVECLMNIDISINM